MNFLGVEQSEEEISLELTPLIDMVFQLLIFFLITTTFAVNVKEGGIEVDMPKANSSQIPAMATQAVVAILKDGRLVMGNENLSLSALRQKLQEIKEKNPKVMVVVQADKSVEHWRVVQTMDTAATVGIHRLAIATVKE